MGLHFSEEEFKSRKSKVLNSMKAMHIDALCCLGKNPCTG